MNLKPFQALEVSSLFQKLNLEIHYIKEIKLMPKSMLCSEQVHLKYEQN